jgi:hypothetical protein
VKANRDRGNDVSHLLFRDIEMKDVKNALTISEYYPKVLPPDPDPPRPVRQLTPHFHDIALENVIATSSASAGAIAGLPEAPIRGLVLRNVTINAQKGLSISNAEVSGESPKVQVAEGPEIIKAAGAVVSLH